MSAPKAMLPVQADAAEPRPHGQIRADVEEGPWRPSRMGSLVVFVVEHEAAEVVIVIFVFDVEIVVERTHSCYTGDRHTRHGWGYGCGACPACELRAGGYQRFMERHTA